MTTALKCFGEKKNDKRTPKYLTNQEYDEEDIWVYCICVKFCEIITIATRNKIFNNKIIILNIHSFEWHSSSTQLIIFISWLEWVPGFQTILVGLFGWSTDWLLRQFLSTGHPLKLNKENFNYHLNLIRHRKFVKKKEQHQLL